MCGKRKEKIKIKRPDRLIGDPVIPVCQSLLTIASVSVAIISSSFVGMRYTFTFEFFVESSTVLG